MSICSLDFLVFIIATAVVYFAIPKAYQWICLLVSSYIFYLWGGGYRTVQYIIITTATVFFAAKLIQNATTKSKKKTILILALLLNVGILSVLKYGNFIVSTIIQEGSVFSKLALPLGISFYTFQALGYLIDVYRGKTSADQNFFRFALFVSYFPQIIQGPISRYDNLANQLYAPHGFEYDRVKYGIERVVWGYFKKLVVAERVSILTSYVFKNYQLENLGGATIFFSVLLYGIQVYTDFSGGIDIIIGISEIFGITQTENFRQPFMAKSVAEYWQRWHITLGTWMRDYVFYPIALSKPFAKFGKFVRKTIGNKAGKILPASIASFSVFVLVGIWHGADWKYVLYGVYMATFVACGTLLADVYSRMRNLFHVDEESKWWKVFQMIRTLLVITIGRYFSCAPSLGDALRMLRVTFGNFNSGAIFGGVLADSGMSQRAFWLMLIAILVVFIVDVMHECGIKIRDAIEKQHMAIIVMIYIIAIFAIIIFGIYGAGFEASNFIYQGF